jgi:hypothetical protein
MRHPFLLAALLTITLPSAAQSVRDYPWLNGERLLKLYSQDGKEVFRKGHGKFSRDELASYHDQMNEARADAYIDGIHDMSEGKAWCYSEKYHPKPDTLRDEVLVELRKLPKDQLKRNAADLIVEVWASKWPCGGNR